MYKGLLPIWQQTRFFLPLVIGLLLGVLLSLVLIVLVALVLLLVHGEILRKYSSADIPQR